MTLPIYSRGVVTDLILDHLGATIAPRILVGDAIAPEDGGWSGGQPGEGSFLPYVVLTAAVGNHNLKDPAVRMNTSFTQAYSLRAVGARRAQCDLAGDDSRSAIFDLIKQQVDEHWKILLVTYQQIGPITRNDEVTPPLFEALDTFVLWLERST